VLERREPEKFQVSPMAQKNPRSHAALVLIVDDDEAIVEVTAEVLETLGYDILTAQDGPEALELLRSNSRISILFTDIQMPGMGGKELAEIAVMLRPGTGGSDMTHAERAAKRARAIYEAALFSTLMQQESATASELGDDVDFDVTLRETLVRMVSKELQK
jgi:CheY-like chemotaxis protein